MCPGIVILALTAGNGEKEEGMVVEESDRVDLHTPRISMMRLLATLHVLTKYQNRDKTV